MWSHWYHSRPSKPEELFEDVNAIISEEEIGSGDILKHPSLPEDQTDAPAAAADVQDASVEADIGSETEIASDTSTPSTEAEN